MMATKCELASRGPEPGSQPLTEQPEGPAFDRFDQTANAASASRNEQAHVVGHRFELDARQVLVRADLREELSESLVDLVQRNRAPALRRSQEVTGASGGKVAAGLRQARNVQPQRGP